MKKTVRIAAVRQFESSTAARIVFGRGRSAEIGRFAAELGRKASSKTPVWKTSPQRTII